MVKVLENTFQTTRIHEIHRISVFRERFVFHEIFMKIHANMKFPQSAVELIVPLVK